MKLSAPAGMVGTIAALVLSVTLSACSLGGGGGQQGGSSLIDTGQPQSDTPSEATTTPERAASGRAAPTGTPGPSGPANVKIASNQVESGNLILTIEVGAARRMFAEGSPQSAPTPQGQNPQGQGGPAQQEMVLGGQMMHVSNNLDAAQAPPPDPKESTGDFIRHAAVQVKDKDTGQVVPYLAVTMDILKDGRPVEDDIGLVPMVPVGGGPDQLHYGNNVAFPGKGRYQLFVRMPGNPMLGNNAAPYAQFDVTIE